MKTSVLYPPSAGYRRPERRAFWIWRDRFISRDPAWAAAHGWGQVPWRWCCTLCEPPSYGFRTKAGGWQSIVTVSMPRHFAHRGAHHAWAARRPPGMRRG